MNDESKSKAPLIQTLTPVNMFFGPKMHWGRLGAFAVILFIICLFTFFIVATLINKPHEAMGIVVFIPALPVLILLWYIDSTFGPNEGINVFGTLMSAKKFLRFWVAFFSLATILSFCGVFVSLGVYKPVIYLYPEKTMPVRVWVEMPQGHLTITDPAVDSGNGWSVIAHPGSQIVLNGQTYPYLFYEADMSSQLDLEKAWVVPRENASAWFREMLPRMGLNERETKDFTDYWDVNLPDAKYYRISLLSKENLDRAIKLHIEPAPDTTIRVMLVIEKLDSPVAAEPPVLAPPERKGFTVVEWGVILK